MPRRPCSDQNLSTSPCPPLIVVLDPVLQVQFREFRIGPPSQRNQYHSCQVMMMMMMIIMMVVDDDDGGGGGNHGHSQGFDDVEVEKSHLAEDLLEEKGDESKMISR